VASTNLRVIDYPNVFSVICDLFKLC